MLLRCLLCPMMIILLCVVPWPDVEAQTEMFAEITSQVISVGEEVSVTVRIEGDFRSEPPICEPNGSFQVAYNLFLDWGESVPLSDAITALPFVWTIRHVYTTPGRYPLWFKASWRRVPGASGLAASAGGPAQQKAPHNPCAVGPRHNYEIRTLIDVLPDANVTTDGEIGVYYNPEGTLCAPASTTPVKRLYVVAKLDGASGNGIRGAVFRLRPTRAGFTYTMLPPAGWILIGDVFGDGVEMAPAACQGTAAGFVTLMEILAFPTDEEPAYANLLIEPHLNPSNPNYQTSMFILCDAPTFTASPAGLGYLAMISTVEHAGPCLNAPVPVRQRAWSEVKQIFRE